MSQLKKGALLNYMSIVFTNVIGLLLTPLIIRKLGADEYGIYITIGALIGTISILDFGLNNTIIRFVAKYRAENDRKGEENFLATSFLIYIVLSILVVIAGVSFYNSIETYFVKMNLEEIRIAKTIFAILIFNLAIKLPGGSFLGICSGYEEFIFPKTIDIIKNISRSLVVVAILYYGGGAISIVIIDTVFNVVLIIITAYFVFSKLKVRFKLYTFTLDFILTIFKYSVWVFMFSIVGVFQWKAGHWILGKISRPDALAVYGVGIVLGTYYGAFSFAISSVFLPRATQMTVGKASGEELTDMMIKIGRISLIMLLYILGGFILIGKQFVFLWVGESYYDSWIIALIIMLGYTIPLVQFFGTSILEARNKLAFKAIIYFICLVLGTGVGFALAQTYGGIGMISGSVLGMVVAQIFLNFYYVKVIKLNILRFFRKLFGKTLVTFLLVLLIGYALQFIPDSGWLVFLLKGVCYSVIYLGLMYFFGIVQSEKELFDKFIYGLLRKLKIKK